MREASIYAIITAAGQSRRMGGADKLTLSIHGRPLLAHTTSIFMSSKQIKSIAIAVSSGREEELAELLRRHCSAETSQTQVITGGKERQESIYLALEYLKKHSAPKPEDIVLIHDAARPFVDTSLIEMLIGELAGYDGVIPAVPVRDTVKRVKGQDVLYTEDREELRMVQTPQVFRFDTIHEMHHRARSDSFLGTDDASLIEHYGGKVRWVLGPTHNLKVTVPEDIALLSYLSNFSRQPHE